jgi:hypothetical protein
MNKILPYFLYITLVLFSANQTKAQDVPIMQMAVGAASNVSMLSNGINNAGGYFSLEYLITRNIFIGFQADYLFAQNNIQFINPSFSNGVTFPGDTIKIKENITKINAGLYAGYKFFPLNKVSINLAASINNISLDRKFKNNSVLINEAVDWYANNWAANTANAIGVSASFDFYLNKTTMFRAGVNYQDITNMLLSQRDNNIVKEISYTDNKISSIAMHSKPYQALDIYLALVFKLGLKKI